MSKILCKHHYVNFVHRAFSNKIWYREKPLFTKSETVFQAVLIPHQAIFVQSVHAAQNVPFFDLYVYRRERGVLCRFARFPFSRRASPAASSPPSADAVSSPSTPFRSGASDASSPNSDTQRPERRSSKQRQRHLSFPSQCHHCTAEGRKAGTRPYRLPYSHLIQSAAHRQIGRKRQQHQICTHRRRQAEHDRPHRQSPLLHSIAPHPSRSKERMPQGCILYPGPRKKCAKKRRPFGRRFRVRIGFT